MKNFKKESIIVFLLLLIIWLSTSVIRLENYHYANQVGLCLEFEFPQEGLERDKCLNDSQTRTNPFLHLLYGLGIL
jgi:hypothetical protein